MRRRTAKRRATSCACCLEGPGPAGLACPGGKHAMYYNLQTVDGCFQEVEAERWAVSRVQKGLGSHVLMVLACRTGQQPCQ
jgi:hypothetical protein